MPRADSTRPPYNQGDYVNTWDNKQTMNPGVTVWNTYSQCTGSWVSIATGTSSLVLAQNVDRKYLRLTNDSAQSLPAYLSFGYPAGVGAGIRLAPSGAYPFEMTGLGLYCGPIYATHSNALPVTINIHEGWDTPKT